MAVYFIRFNFTFMNEAGICTRSSSARLLNQVSDGSLFVQADQIAGTIPLFTSDGGSFAVGIDPGDASTPTEAGALGQVGGAVEYQGPQGSVRLTWSHLVGDSPLKVTLGPVPPMGGWLRGVGVTTASRQETSPDGKIMGPTWAGDVEVHLTRRRLVHWFIKNQTGNDLTLESFVKGQAPATTADEPAPSDTIPAGSLGTWRSDYAGTADPFTGLCAYTTSAVASTKDAVLVAWVRKAAGQRPVVAVKTTGRLRFKATASTGEGDTFLVYRPSAVLAATRGVNVIDRNTARTIREKILLTAAQELAYWNGRVQDPATHALDQTRKQRFETMSDLFARRLKYSGNSNMNNQQAAGYLVQNVSQGATKDEDGHVKSGFPHWCGMFGTWVARQSGAIGAPRWILGRGPEATAPDEDTPTILYVANRKDLLKPGDVGALNNEVSHHVVAVENVRPGQADVIQGNSGPFGPARSIVSRGANVSFPSFYCTAPAPECIDDAYRDSAKLWNCPFSSGKAGDCPSGFGPSDFADLKLPVIPDDTVP